MTPSIGLAMCHSKYEIKLYQASSNSVAIWVPYLVVLSGLLPRQLFKASLGRGVPSGIAMLQIRLIKPIIDIGALPGNGAALGQDILLARASALSGLCFLLGHIGLVPYQLVQPVHLEAIMAGPIEGVADEGRHSFRVVLQARPGEVVLANALVLQVPMIAIVDKGFAAAKMTAGHAAAFAPEARGTAIHIAGVDCHVERGVVFLISIHGGRFVLIRAILYGFDARSDEGEKCNGAHLSRWAMCR